MNNENKSTKEKRFESYMVELGEINDPRTGEIEKFTRDYIEELKWKIKEWENINNNLLGENLKLKSHLPLLNSGKENLVLISVGIDGDSTGEIDVALGMIADVIEEKLQLKEDCFAKETTSNGTEIFYQILVKKTEEA